MDKINLEDGYAESAQKWINVSVKNRYLLWLQGILALSLVSGPAIWQDKAPIIASVQWWQTNGVGNVSSGTRTLLGEKITGLQVALWWLKDECKKWNIDTSRIEWILSSLTTNENQLRQSISAALNELYKRFGDKFKIASDSKKEELWKIWAEIKKRIDTIGGQEEDLIELIIFIEKMRATYKLELSWIDLSKFTKMSSYLHVSAMEFNKNIVSSTGKNFGFMPSEELKKFGEDISSFLLKNGELGNAKTVAKVGESGLKNIVPKMYSGKKSNWSIHTEGTDAVANNGESGMIVKVKNIKKDGVFRLSFSGNIPKNSPGSLVTFKIQVISSSPSIQELIRIKLGHDGQEATGKLIDAANHIYEVSVPRDANFKDGKFQANIMFWKGGDDLILSEPATINFGDPELVITK